MTIDHTQYTFKELERAYIAKRLERHKEIAAAYNGQRTTYHKVAKEYGLTPMAVRRIALKYKTTEDHSENGATENEHSENEHSENGATE